MKATNYTNIKDLQIKVNFNQQADLGGKVYPAVITINCNAITTEGGILPIQVSSPIGSATATPLTIQQIYTQVNKTTVGGLLAN